MSCKNCIHYEFIKTNAFTYCLCSQAFNFKEELRHNREAKCNYFKDKSHFVELPCKVGETVFIIKNNKIFEKEIIYYKKIHSRLIEENEEYYLAGGKKQNYNK